MNSYAGDIIALNGLGTLYKTSQHILLLSDTPMQATSTSVWNGGTAMVNGWLNLKVDGHCDISASPAHTLHHYAAGLGIDSPLAGMMTAASMNSLRYSLTGDDATVLACIVTAGIENARRAGDTADEQPQPGTINIALVCNRHFSPAAAIEALLIATEAKTAACYDLGIRSPVSQQIATGTGTDSPVRGFRPIRASRCFTEKAPKPRSSTRSPRASAAVISSKSVETMRSTSR